MTNVKLLLLTAVLVSAVSFGAPTSTKKSAKAKTKSNVTTSTSAPSQSDPVAATTAPTVTDPAAAPTTVAPASESPAAVANPGSTAAAVTIPSVSDAKVIGLIDLRPGYDIAAEKSTSENAVRLGYQFEKNLAVYYHQDFSGQAEVIKDMRLDTGRIYTDIKNIAQIGSMSLSYQSRIMLPVGQYLRDDGMVLVARNYFNLKQDLGSGFAVTFSESPFIPIFNKDLNAAGTKANAAFQNRVTITPEVTLINDRLSIICPIVWDTIKRRGADGAWDDALWIAPELGYNLNNNVVLGLAYYNNNFIKQGPEDGLALDMGEGFKNGLLQLVVTATL